MALTRTRNDSTTLTAPVQASSLVDVIAERIEEGIFSGALAPGSKISEQALAETFGVSRGPLREAISRLEGRKLIVRVPNLGPRVASFSGEDLLNVLVIRESLEGLAARLACLAITDAELAALRRLLSEHSRQKGILEGTGYYQESKDFDFHFHIIQASRNERLISILCDDLYDLLRLYRYKFSQAPGRAKDAFWEHNQILTALESRNPDLAEAVMKKHLATARKHIELSVRKSDSQSPMVLASQTSASATVKKTAIRQK